MSLKHHRGTFCLFVGPWRIRWVERNFRPLYAERFGSHKWVGVGRLKVTNTNWWATR